jgi:hypothetical protein
VKHLRQSCSQQSMDFSCIKTGMPPTLQPSRQHTHVTPFFASHSHHGKTGALSEAPTTVSAHEQAADFSYKDRSALPLPAPKEATLAYPSCIPQPVQRQEQVEEAPPHSHAYNRAARLFSYSKTVSALHASPSTAYSACRKQPLSDPTASTTKTGSAE